eukprot:1844339-Pleurochrysis_carterae.AAC.1
MQREQAEEVTEQARQIATGCGRQGSAESARATSRTLRRQGWREESSQSRGEGFLLGKTKMVGEPMASRFAEKSALDEKTVRSRREDSALSTRLRGRVRVHESSAMSRDSMLGRKAEATRLAYD